MLTIKTRFGAETVVASRLFERRPAGDGDGNGHQSKAKPTDKRTTAAA
jgi:hypothetical protein